MNAPDKRASFQELVSKAQGRWREIIQALSIVDVSEAISALDSSGARHVKCPAREHGTSNRQFRFFPDFNETGGGICNTCGGFQSGFKMLEFLNGWEFRQCVKEVSQYLDGSLETKSTQKVQRRPTETRAPSVNERRKRQLEEVWNGTTELTGTIGEAYLRNRGITSDLPSSGSVRFHPGLRYWDSEQDKCLGEFPAIVALIQSPTTSAPITIHRTYLSEDGRKASVVDAKKVMPSAVGSAMSACGGAIQLFPAIAEELAVCEGIETGLSIRSAHPSLPVWACISAQVLTKFRPPAGVKRVSIWGDLDPGGAGQVASAKLALLLEEQGIETVIHLPVSDSDHRRVFVCPESKHWVGGSITIERLKTRLEQSGYQPSNRRSPSSDWDDVYSKPSDRTPASAT